MSKKDFIALADHIKQHNNFASDADKFTDVHIAQLARFCKSQNYAFKTDRWLQYIKQTTEQAKTA